MKTILKIMGTAFMVIVIFIIGYGFYLSMKSTNICKNECNNQGALGHYLISSGNWKLDDSCICFFKDRISAFKLNESELCRIKDVCEIDMGMKLGGAKP